MFDFRTRLKQIRHQYNIDVSADYLLGRTDNPKSHKL